MTQFLEIMMLALFSEAAHVKIITSRIRIAYLTHQRFHLLTMFMNNDSPASEALCTTSGTSQ